jgi:gluconolactonase
VPLIPAKRLLTVASIVLGVGLLPLAESVAAGAAPTVRVLATALRGPEGPTVLADGSILLVEFFSGDVVRIRPGGTRELVAHIGVGIAGTARRGEGPVYVARVNYELVRPDRSTAPMPDSRGEILSVDLHNGRVSPLYTEYQGAALQGPDDLVVDARGDLWWTDVLEQAVYWGRADGSEIRRVVGEASGVNGIALSPDGVQIYVVSNRRLVSYHIAGRGLLEMDGSQPRAHVLTPLSSSLQRLDGLKTESNGNIIMADWAEGLIVMSPDGRLISRTRIPGNLKPVNMAFGATTERTLYVAATAEDVEGWKSQGKLIAIAWPNTGN